MKKQAVHNSPVDLKQFFEASVDALGSGGDGKKASDRNIVRNHPLFRRAGTDGRPGKRALTDAANALAALWKIQAAKSTPRVRIPVGVSPVEAGVADQ